MATCKEAFAERDQLTKHVESEHTKAEPNSRTEARTHLTKSESAAVPPNQFICYFDGCDQTFEAADKLNEHLIIQHNMLYKDIEARSKMNLLFLEQFKHQMAEQYAAATAGGNGELLTNAASFATPPSQHTPTAAHLSTARFALKSEINVNTNI